MGINGLLPCLRSVTRPAHVSAYAGKRVAVDSYVWLHRGVFTCARELALGQATDKCVACVLLEETHPDSSVCAVRYVAYFLRCVEVMRAAGVEPVCVFDGDKLPSKAAEEAERATCVRASESTAPGHAPLRGPAPLTHACRVVFTSQAPRRVPRARGGARAHRCGAWRYTSAEASARLRPRARARR